MINLLVYLLITLLFIYQYFVREFYFFQAQFIYFQFFTSILIILWTAKKLYFVQDDIIKLHKLELLIIAFIVYIFFNYFYTSTFYLNSNISSSFFLFVILYFIFKDIFQHKISKTVILVVLLIIGFAQGFHGLNQYCNSALYDPLLIKGFLLNSGVFANYLVIFLSLNLSILFLCKLNNLSRCFLLFSAIIIISVLILAQARTAWIAGLTSTFIILSVRIKLSHVIKNKNINTYLKVSLSVFTIIIAFVLGYYIYHFKHDSALGRILIYENSLKMLKDYPLFGIGFGKFETVYPLYQSNYFKENPYEIEKGKLTDDIRVAYNEFLQIGVELGFLGLILLGLFLYHFFKTKNVKETIIAKNAIITIFICSLFSYPLHSMHVWILLVCFFAYIISE